MEEGGRREEGGDGIKTESTKRRLHLPTYFRSWCIGNSTFLKYLHTNKEKNYWCPGHSPTYLLRSFLILEQSS